MSACEIITDAAKLETLRDDWRRLWNNAHGAYYSQSFPWCVTSWRKLDAERRHELHCLVMRENGRVVLIWPLVVRRQAMWRIARPLEQVTTEYGAVLAEGETKRRIAEAWRFIRQNLRCDVFLIQTVPANSDLDEVLREAEPQAGVHAVPRRLVKFDGFTDWLSYYRSVKNDKRRGLERRIRRLTEQGEITFSALSDPAARAEAIDWIFKNKMDWLSEQEKAAVWGDIPQYRDFLAALPVDGAGDEGGLAVSVLKFNGQIVAGEVARIDRERVEPFMSTYDAAYGKYSPGEILCMHAIQAAHARGLTYDFRIGDDMYKAYWANAADELRSYRIAANPLGALRNTLSSLRAELRARAAEKRDAEKSEAAREE